MDSDLHFCLTSATRQTYIQIAMARMAIRNVERNLGNEFFHVDKVTRDWADTLRQLTSIPVLQPSTLNAIDGTISLRIVVEKLRAAVTLVERDTTERGLRDEAMSGDHDYPQNVALCMRALRLVSWSRYFIRSWQQAVIARFVGLSALAAQGEWPSTWSPAQAAKWESEREVLYDLFMDEMRATAHPVAVANAPQADWCFAAVVRGLDECQKMARSGSGDDVARCTVSRELLHQLNMLRTVYPWRYNPQLQTQAIRLQRDVIRVMQYDTVYQESIRHRVGDVERYQDDKYHCFSAVDPMLGEMPRTGRYPFLGVLDPESVAPAFRTDKDSPKGGPTYFAPEVCLGVVGDDGDSASVLKQTARLLRAATGDGPGHEPRACANITLAQHLMEVIDCGRNATQFSVIYTARNVHLIAFKRRLEAFASCDLGENDRTPEQVFADAFRVYCLLCDVPTPLRYIAFEPGQLLAQRPNERPPAGWIRPVGKAAYAPGELEAVFLGLFVRVLGMPQKGGRHALELSQLNKRFGVSATGDGFALDCTLPKAESDACEFPAFFDAYLTHAKFTSERNLTLWKRSVAGEPLRLTFPLDTHDRTRSTRRTTPRTRVI